MPVFAPSNGEFVTGENGSSFFEENCDIWRSFDWDGEEYGNPRVVGGAPDIGFDEAHFFISAGSHGNDSNSHNVVNSPALLNAGAPTGTTTRFFILPINAGGGNLTINTKLDTPQQPVSAWTRPVGTLAVPIQNTGLPPDFQFQWIGFNNPRCTPTQPNDGVE